MSKAEQIMKSISELFSDRSFSQQMVLGELVTIAEHLGAYIDALEDDIRRGES